MSPSRRHVIAALAVLATTLTIAGCAAESIHRDGSAASSSSVSTSDAPPVPIGETTEVAGTTVSGADGYASEGAPISDIADTAAIVRLDPDLRRAVVRATGAAAAEGVRVVVNSGWRSALYQQALLDQGITEHGSLEEARHWVNTPERSTHVRGQAVDVGSWDAAAWMQEHGRDFGLCQTYENESWHYELSTTGQGSCPGMLRDSSAG